MDRKTFAQALLVIWSLLLFQWTTAHSQSRPPHPIQVLISPDKPDWTYEPGEDATFTVRILKHQVPVEDAEFFYAIGPEKMPPHSKGTMQLKTGVARIKGKLNEPGFLRCDVRIRMDGRDYRGLATAGYAPESIQPTQSLPADFGEFWEKAIADLTKIPLDVRMTLLPDRGTETVEVYQVSFQNEAIDSRIYGIMAKPRAPGRYPAVLRVPGAGIQPYGGLIDLAEDGVITLQIGIHGIPVIYERGIYNDLRRGALNRYWLSNLDNRDHYYYKRVYLGCVRAVEFLASRTEVDTDRLAVWGGSQGGALAIVTAALDKRVNYLASIYPALSDLTGYLHGRAGGWPHLFNARNAPSMATEQKIKTSAYYDVVNFARMLRVPGYYTWGYNDETCPPTSYYAAYNVITAPKELDLVQETGHWLYPEQRIRMQEWLLRKLKNH